MSPRQKPFYIVSSGIPRDFLVHGKPATAIQTAILTVSWYLFRISVTAWPETSSQVRKRTDFLSC